MAEGENFKEVNMRKRTIRLACIEAMKRNNRNYKGIIVDRYNNNLYIGIYMDGDKFVLVYATYTKNGLISVNFGDVNF